VEVVAEKMMFFSKDEIVLGYWKKKFKEETGMDP
jgi:hypothetical protein